MKVFKDGDHWCIAEDDFINLQESPCAFVPVDSLMGRLIAHFEEFKKGNPDPGELIQVPPIWSVGEIHTESNTISSNSPWGRVIV